MTKFTILNDLKGDEAQELIRLLRRRSSNFLDWGYDEKCFWIQTSAYVRNPWPDVLRELFKRPEAA